MDTVTVLVAHCHVAINFMDPASALEFVKMLAHTITADTWLAYVSQTMPDHLDDAKEIVQACLGTPA